MNIRLVGLALVCGASFGAHADDEHDRIVAERAAANAKLAGTQRECETRFVVSICVEEARNENRAVLAQLRQRELQLDERRRRADADARRKAIAERAEGQQARASEATPEPPHVRVRRKSEPVEAVPNEPAETRVTHRSNSRSVGDPKSQAEQHNIEKFEARQREAKSHRDTVERRNAERVRQGKLAKPLSASEAARP